MLKIIAVSLMVFTSTSFADKTWDQLIAEGQGTKPLATNLLNEAFRKKAGLKTSDDIEKHVEKYENFYFEVAEKYAAEAALSIKGKEPKDAITDPKYIAYRNFILYGKDINKHLEGSLLYSIAQNANLEPALLKAIEYDPQREIKDGFAEIYFGRLLTPNKRDVIYLGDVGKIMKILNKEEIAREIKWIEENEEFGKETNLCNPPFWLVTRIITGKQPHLKFDAKIKAFHEKLDDLEKRKPESAGVVKSHRDRCKVAEHIRNLSDEDIKKLNTDDDFAENFWFKALGHPDGELSKDDKILVAISADKREHLQLITKFLLKEQNKEKISPTIKLSK